jgi:ATP-dependent 26S proteasome regulatory subunit
MKSRPSCQNRNLSSGPRRIRPTVQSLLVVAQIFIWLMISRWNYRLMFATDSVHYLDPTPNLVIVAGSIIWSTLGTWSVVLPLAAAVWISRARPWPDHLRVVAGVISLLVITRSLEIESGNALVSGGFIARQITDLAAANLGLGPIVTALFGALALVSVAGYGRHLRNSFLVVQDSLVSGLGGMLMAICRRMRSELDRVQHNTRLDFVPVVPAGSASSSPTPSRSGVNTSDVVGASSDGDGREQELDEATTGQTGLPAARVELSSRRLPTPEARQSTPPPIDGTSSSEDHRIASEIASFIDLTPSERGIAARKTSSLLSCATRPLTSTTLREAVHKVVGGLRQRQRKLEVTGRRRGSAVHSLDDLTLVPGHDFDSVVGMHDLKKRIRTCVMMAMNHDCRLMATRVTGNSPRMTGFLLYGAPGTGKSFFVEAAAGELVNICGARVFRAGIEAIKGLHWSKQVRRIVDVFELAKRCSPSAVIWDEIDGIASDPRATGRRYDAERSTVFKQQLESVCQSSNLVLQGATTNFPHHLELALLRDGRFGERIHVAPPDKETRKELIGVGLEGMWLEEEIDITTLVSWTSGNTAAEIAAFLNKVGTKVITENMSRPRNPRGIYWHDFEACCDFLEQRIFPAWLSEVRTELAKPCNSGKREFFQDLFESDAFDV